MEQLTKYWDDLKPNEQVLVKIAAACLAVLFLVFAVIKPLNNSIAATKKEIANNQELTHFINQAAATISAAGGRVQATGDLMQIVNSTSRRYGIGISKIQPKDDSVRLTLESIEFSKLLTWLDELVNKQGLSVESLDMNKSDKPGYVVVTRLVIEK